MKKRILKTVRQKKITSVLLHQESFFLLDKIDKNFKIREVSEILGDICGITLNPGRKRKLLKKTELLNLKFRECHYQALMPLISTHFKMIRFYD